MATVNLGAIKFNWKGAFNNSTAYAVDDVVSSSGSSYVCILASQGNAVSNGTYWNQMSSAGTNGTNGTDLSTTLTTRGDLVFKGASALTRLPKGTAGYYLKQGANDPEWAELSGGDVVKLARVNQTSNTSALLIDGYFNDSIYHKYKLVCNHWKAGSQNADNQPQFSLLVGGSNNTDANTSWVLGESYLSASSAQTTRNGEDDSHVSQMQGTWQAQAQQYDEQAFDITIFRPQSTSDGKLGYWNLAYAQSSGGGIYVITQGMFYKKTTTATTGFRFTGTGDTFTGDFVLYGYKK
jgi:hypothetical protein